MNVFENLLLENQLHLNDSPFTKRGNTRGIFLSHGDEISFQSLSHFLKPISSRKLMGFCFAISIGSTPGSGDFQIALCISPILNRGTRTPAINYPQR